MKIIKTLIPYIVIIVIVVIIRTFIVTPVIVNGPSMENTLFDGDVMFLDKISYKNNDIKRFDIVVIKTTKNSIIKRVIGLPGEEVYLKDGDVYVNDKKLKQTYNYVKSDDTFILPDVGYITIPKGMYFVLGDNRVESADSRVMGLIKERSIIGKTNFTIWPIRNFGFK